MHDDNPPPLNTTKRQGETIGHTGTKDSGSGMLTGDHCHLNTAFGTYQGWYTVSTGKRQLVNSSHVYDTFFVNDTNLIHDYGYNWQIYNGGITPHLKKYKFKWVLYANKLRQKRNV